MQSLRQTVTREDLEKASMPDAFWGYSEETFPCSILDKIEEKGPQDEHQDELQDKPQDVSKDDFQEDQQDESQEEEVEIVPYQLWPLLVKQLIADTNKVFGKWLGPSDIKEPVCVPIQDLIKWDSVDLDILKGICPESDLDDWNEAVQQGQRIRDRNQQFIAAMKSEPQ